MYLKCHDLKLGGFVTFYLDGSCLIFSKVSIVKGERGYEPVFKALDLINFKKILSGWDRVLIKVNFITTKKWDTGATTDPIVVESIIRKLQDIPIETYVVESDSTGTNADKAFDVTGMKEIF